MTLVDLDRRAAPNDRLVDVLHALISRSDAATGWGVRELADQLDISRSTVNRILQSLVELQMAEQDGHSHYSVGPRTRALARRLFDPSQLLGAAAPHIAKVARECDATALMVLFDPTLNACVVTAVSVGPNPIRYGFRPGSVVPLHAGAAGQAVLSELGVQALAAGEQRRFTPDTHTTLDELRRVAAAAQERGFAVSVGQHLAGAAGVAAPFSVAGLLGAVSATRPREFTSDEQLQRFGSYVCEGAHALSRLQPKLRVQPLDDLPHRIAPAPATPLGKTTTWRFERLLTSLVGNPAGIEASGRKVGARIDTSPATALKLLATVEDSALITRVGDRVLAGPRLFQWAAFLGRAGVADIAAPILRRVADATGETVGLVDYDPAQRRAQMATVITGRRPLRYQVDPGVSLPLHAGAAGKAILACLPDSVVDDLDLESFTDRTPHTAEELRDELAAIRSRGWATGIGERVPDAYGIAAPFYVDDVVAGSVTVTIPRHQAHEDDLAAIADTVVEACRAISALLSVVGR